MVDDKRAEDAVNFILKTACEYAQAKANRVYLEEFRKSKKALLMGESAAKSSVEREQYAYSHKDYAELIEGLRIAVESEETLKWKMEAARLTVEIYRTQSANNRTVDRVTQ